MIVQATGPAYCVKRRVRLSVWEQAVAHLSTRDLRDYAEQHVDDHVDALHGPIVWERESKTANESAWHCFSTAITVRANPLHSESSERMWLADSLGHSIGLFGMVRLPSREQ